MSAEIAALRTRSASYGLKNDPTADALALLDRSVAELEQLHAEGLSRGEIPMLRTMFDSQLHMLIELEEAKKRTPAEARAYSRSDRACADRVAAVAATRKKIPTFSSEDEEREF